MIKVRVVVETKSRSKHTFDVETEGTATFLKSIQTGMSYERTVRILNTIFQVDNITSIKVEEIS